METQTRTSGADAATLGLGSVLVGSSPAAPMTDEAPDRCTTEAATRRPDRDEITEILGSEPRDRLAKAGCSTAELTISGRRMEIENTNLEELRDGLGGVLADRLAATRVAELDQRSAGSDDRARIDDWIDEGGHGR